jgi:hypothetical protein
MAKPAPDQYSSNYVALLMFKYTFGMLTRKERKILSAWRKLPGNEEFFQDTTSPENLNKRMREMEEQQIHNLSNAQEMFDHLPESSKN